MNKNGDTGHLTQYLSSMGAWALAFGCCVGWGAFVMPGTTFLPVAGPVGTLIGLGIGTLLMIVLAANYHFMMKRCPGAGGAYAYASKAFGSDHGFLSGWFMILAYIVVFWGNATALPMIARNLLGNIFQFGFHYTVFGYDVYLGEVLLSVVAMLLVSLICLRPRLAMWVQIIFAVLLFAGVVILTVTVFLKTKNLSDLSPEYAPDVDPSSGIFSIISLAPWAFVGFETISHSSGEFRFQQKKSFGIMVIALVCAFIAYAFLALVSIAHLPEGQTGWVGYLSQIASFSGISGLPAFASVQAVMGNMGVLGLGLTAFAAIFTGLIGFATASSRLLYSISQDGLLPPKLKQVNSKGVPAFTVFAILVISIPVMFLGRTAINWLIDVTSICIIIAYAYVSASAMRTAKQEGKKSAMIIGIIGLVISVGFVVVFLVPNLLLIRTLSVESYLLIAIWSILGLLWFRHMFKKESSRLKSPSTFVWGVFLALIVYASMIWVLQTAAEVEVQTSVNIEAYYAQESTDLTEEELEGSATYVQNEMKSANRVLRNVSMVQIGFVVVAMLIIFSIFSIMQKRTKKMEIDKIRAEENSQAKSAFLSNMSHDIRTPMNAIIGMTDIAFKHIDDQERVKDSLSKIALSGRQLLGVINDVLDISKIESGKMTLAPADMSLNQTIEAMNDIIRPQTEEKGQKFDIITGDIICADVFCDSVRLNQVLLNLLSNAMKYTPQNGSVQLRLWQLPSQKGDEYVETHFEVKDNGIGMSKEYQEKLFTSFEREANQTVHKTQGTGLGLSITKYIVDAMEGRIQVVSEVGKGSSFEVIVDLKRAEQGASQTDGGQINADENGSVNGIVSPDKLDLSGKVFLLAEDNDLNAEIATMIFEESGAAVERAEDGQIAVRMFGESEPGHYDAVFMDLRMPNMNGLEAAKAIRQMEREDASKVPIIAMSADAFADDVQRCLDVGMNSHLAKPIDLKQLMAAIRQYILQ